MRGFTILELLVVIFIMTAVTFIAFPSLWTGAGRSEENVLASSLRALRDEAVTTRQQTYFTVNFKERFFKIKGVHQQRVIAMADDEIWELCVPSRGIIKEGEVTVIFPPTVNEEFIALYLTRGDKTSTIVVDNLTGETEVQEGRAKFD